MPNEPSEPRRDEHSGIVLSVNVDHVATLRQARRAGYPTPVEAAHVAEAAGAQGITVHLRQDRRHIQEHDVAELRRAIRGRLNLEIAASDEMVRIALRERPHQVSLVPERPEELTTEGGLDLVGQRHRIREVSSRLSAEGIAVSAFVDPQPHQLEIAAELGTLSGVEINTDVYTQAFAHSTAAAERELEQIQRCAQQAQRLRLRVFAGHGLTSANVGPIAAIPVVEELNIGHWIVSRAVIVGMRAAVEEMLQAVAKARA